MMSVELIIIDSIRSYVKRNKHLLKTTNIAKSAKIDKMKFLRFLEAKTELSDKEHKRLSTVLYSILSLTKI